MNNRTRFQKDVNYLVACRCCKKKTHSSIADCYDLELCRVCYESANLENDHADNGHEEKVAGCPTCASLGCMCEKAEGL